MTSSVIPSIVVANAGENEVNGFFKMREPNVIPEGFAKTCIRMKWDPKGMWEQLSDHKRPWFEAENGSYIYWNKSDGRWWLDGPSGDGLYIVSDDGSLPPEDGWKPLPLSRTPVPKISVADNKNYEIKQGG
eukprot:CAMPEP_0167761044 /NCGR_PEP_ID=MMETSP0110_2-20121227/11933_1 /TAXON_ID=629695 /ORGANISM="Gymnochlora sp., Strain CCMP2014" /LENGTH=130 /DNA_ID=CAMNT_0007647643 /DNA_START=14 /DNA_END=402 /DNA_ORIENTATION=+